METCPDYTRLLVTISHEEPDRVPLVELGIDRPVKEAWLGKPVRDVATDVEFWHRAGYDYIYLRPAYEFPGVTTVATSDAEMGDVGSPSTQTLQTSAPGPIASLDDLERYPWPDPQTVDLSPLEQAAECLPLGMGVISGVTGVFTRTWMLLGFERMVYALRDNPELVERTMQRVGQIQSDVLRRIVHMDRVFAIWYPDDLAYTEGLLMAPEFFRQRLFPWMEELIAVTRGVVMPFILHSDGKLWEVIPDLIAMGVNVLHPIEPKAMDIKEVKARYGKKLTLFGNIDLDATLVRGAPADVRAEVRQRIKDLAPGGGYALGSSNTIARYVPVANYDAMREATFFYGRYPILF